MIHRAFAIIAALAVTAFLSFFALRSALALAAPFQLEYGEGAVLGWTQTIAEGALPYKAIAPQPWSFSVYTPAYMAASAALVALTPGAPWLGGRVLSLLSALALAALLVAVAPRSRRGVGLAMAALWLASPFVFRWATFYRPDLFALTFSALGIVLVRRAHARGSPSLLPWAALAFVVGFYAKQSFFAAPLAATLWLLLVRRGWTWRLVAPGVAAGLLVGAALWAATGGALFDNLVAANANAFSWASVARFYGAFLRLAPVIVALGVVAALATARTREGLLLPLYAGLAFLVSLSIGKAGAWENYFLEPLWALLALGAAWPGWARAEARRWLLPALVLLQLALFLPGFERRSPAEEIAWFREARAENEALHATLDPLPADATIWSETHGPLAESGRPVMLHSFVYTQLHRQGLWDEGPLVAALAAGEGAMLVQRWDAVADPLALDRWSRALLDAGERGFALGERAGQWRARPPLPFPADAPQPLGEGVTLLAWMVTTADGAPLDGTLPPAETVRVSLLLRSETREETPLSVSVQLFTPDGNRIAQDDAMVRGGEGLGGAWPEGALVRDEHLVALPAELAPGEYSMLVALYETGSGAGRGAVTVGGLRVP